MNPAILLSPWLWLAVALASAAFTTHGWIAEKAAFDQFKGGVAATGKAAEVAAKLTEANDVKRKETADAANKALMGANVALARQLLDARSSTSFLPAAAPGSTSPDRACLNREEFERAMGLLDKGVSSIAGKGDQAIIDLNTAKEWAR